MKAKDQTTVMDSQVGFWFTGEDRELGYGDGRIARVGRSHRVEGEIVLCHNGLHAAISPLDALKYARGPVCYLVRVSGDICYDLDKFAGREREYISSFNAEGTLRAFAREQALIHIDKIRPYCSKSEYLLIVDFLRTGESSLRSAVERAAWRAARNADRSASWGAAWGAARSAAWSAAGSAAGSAAWSAAESAARSAESAAWSAARSAESAARVAARSATENAANSAAEKRLKEMLMEKLDPRGLYHEL
jgi:hypothetical protein